jgi:hypothetical protein
LIILVGLRGASRPSSFEKRKKNLNCSPKWEIINGTLITMKKVLLLTFAFALMFGMQFTRVNAQVCVPDMQLSSPGIYPSDTLPLMMVSIPYSHVVQFVFPVDTVFAGFTIPFDSFIVSSISGIPAGLNWECDANHPVCHYVTAPPQLTHGCVTIYGTPTQQSPAWPGYDSVIVDGVAFLTVPFLGSQSIAAPISVYYRTSPLVALNPSTFSNMGLQVAPNPSAFTANVRYTLANAADVKVAVYDVMGKEMMVVANDFQHEGAQEFTIDSRNLAPGAYYLKVNVNDGEFVQTKQFMTIR